MYGECTENQVYHSVTINSHHVHRVPFFSTETQFNLCHILQNPPVRAFTGYFRGERQILVCVFIENI